MKLQWKYLFLFLSGFFFGGTIDHIIFAIRKTSAPYVLELGVTGNLLMALFDLHCGCSFDIIYKKTQEVNASF